MQEKINRLNNDIKFLANRNDTYTDILLAICDKKKVTLTQLAFEYGIDVNKRLHYDKSFTTVETGEDNHWWIWHNGKALSTYEVCNILLEQKDLRKNYEKTIAYLTTINKNLTNKYTILTESLKENNIDYDDLILDKYSEFWKELNSLNEED